MSWSEDYRITLVPYRVFITYEKTGSHGPGPLCFCLLHRGRRPTFYIKGPHHLLLWYGFAIQVHLIDKHSPSTDVWDWRDYLSSVSCWTLWPSWWIDLPFSLISDSFIDGSDRRSVTKTCSERLIRDYDSTRILNSRITLWKLFLPYDDLCDPVVYICLDSTCFTLNPIRIDYGWYFCKHYSSLLPPPSKDRSGHEYVSVYLCLGTYYIWVQSKVLLHL